MRSCEVFQRPSPPETGWSKPLVRLSCCVFERRFFCRNHAEGSSPFLYSGGTGAQLEGSPVTAGPCTSISSTRVQVRLDILHDVTSGRTVEEQKPSQLYALAWIAFFTRNFNCLQGRSIAKAQSKYLSSVEPAHEHRCASSPRPRPVTPPQSSGKKAKVQQPLMTTHHDVSVELVKSCKTATFTAI